MRYSPATLRHQMFRRQGAQFVIFYANIIRFDSGNCSIYQDVWHAAPLQSLEDRQFFLMLGRSEDYPVYLARDEHVEMALFELRIFLCIGDHHLIAEGLE